MLRWFILLAVSLAFTPPARAQEANVYLIKMFDCAHKPAERSQTGFRVRGIKGLVTALHGVADCQRITASSKKGLFLDQPLTIRKIDNDRDVALLSSPQLDGAEDGGFEIAVNIPWESLVTVKIYGHPYGISSLETTLTLRNPPLKPLKDLLPAAPLSILRERRSPNHLINVINLQGNLLPGHSGAPILDSSGRIVAVANGGLKEGFAGISWAVPFNDIEWDSAGSKLRALAQLNPHILFSSDALPTQQLDEANDETCGQLSRLILEAQTGFISIVGDPASEEEPGFFSKIKLPGALSSYVYPKENVTFHMFSSDKDGRIESQYYNLISTVAACLPTWERKEGKVLDTDFTKYRYYLLRSKDKNPIIEISYNLEPYTQGDKYTLHLTIHMASYRKW